MTLTSGGTEATTMLDYNGGRGGLSNDIVLTFPVAASTSLSKGDLVKLSSGFVTSCTATTDNCVGYCDKAVDNSSGLAGDLEAPICVTGFRLVDGIILDSTSTYDAAFVPFTKVGLGTAGQVVASYGGSTGPTVCIGKNFSTQAVSGAADITRTVMVYFNTIGLLDQA